MLSGVDNEPPLSVLVIAALESPGLLSEEQNVKWKALPLCGIILQSKGACRVEVYGGESA